MIWVELAAATSPMSMRAAAANSQELAGNPSIEGCLLALEPRALETFPPGRRDVRKPLDVGVAAELGEPGQVPRRERLEPNGPVGARARRSEVSQAARSGEPA
jgi:hypothetical protein